MAGEALERVAFRFTEAAVREPLEESVDRSSLDVVTWPINKALSDFCDCGEFSGLLALDGIRHIVGECG